MGSKFLAWLGRTPVQTFVLCPLAVIAFEVALNRGRLTIVPWGAPLMAWGYLQYLVVGRWRLPRGAPFGRHIGVSSAARERHAAKPR